MCCVRAGLRFSCSSTLAEAQLVLVPGKDLSHTVYTRRSEDRFLHCSAAVASFKCSTTVLVVIFVLRSFTDKLHGLRLSKKKKMMSADTVKSFPLQDHVC